MIILPTNYFDNVKVDATIAPEEIFICNINFNFEDEEAISIANSTKYGLASRFTSDDQKKMDC